MEGLADRADALGEPSDELLLLALLEERERMLAYVRGEDELDPQEADSRHGQPRILLRLLGHSHVDVDLGRGDRAALVRVHPRGHRGRAAGGGRGLSPLDDPAVDHTGLSVERDLASIDHELGRLSGSDDARHPELARDDRRVARHSALVRNDPRRPGHRGDHVGGGHRRDQDLPRLQLLHLGRSSQDPGHSGRDPRARTEPAEHRPFVVALALGRTGRGRRVAGPRSRGLRDRRHGPRLDDVEGIGVTAPLHVHRPTVVGLDEPRERDEALKAMVGELLGASFGRRDVLTSVPSSLGADQSYPLLG